MSVKLGGKLPDGEKNGLNLIASQLCDNPDRVHVAIVLLDCKSVTVDTDTGDTVPTARVRRVEIVRREDLPAAQKLIRRSLQGRSGETVLPLEMEDEITAAFADIDPRTGEVNE